MDTAGDESKGSSLSPTVITPSRAGGVVVAAAGRGRGTLPAAGGLGPRSEARNPIRLAALSGTEQHGSSRFTDMSNPTRSGWVSRARRLRSLPSALMAALALQLAGCATTPVTYKTHATAAGRVPQLRSVMVAPLDAELSTLSAGGLTEKRDDWTDAAVCNLTAALATETGWKPSTGLAPEQRAQLREETEDVQALLRAITLNHLLGGVPGRNPAASRASSLTYNTGPLNQHTAVLGSDAVLFVFVRDSYATAGRKSLLALSVVGAALTGVAIIPPMGRDVMSAALVDHDGTVLWFNFQIGGADPRTPDGAREVAHKLLAGLPAHKA